MNNGPENIGRTDNEVDEEMDSKSNALELLYNAYEKQFGKPDNESGWTDIALENELAIEEIYKTAEAIKQAQAEFDEKIKQMAEKIHRELEKEEHEQ